MPRTFLIDTDTGSDDAVAIIMALRSPGVRVAAITVVAGNVPLPQATSNALYSAELCASDVPVFAGADRPLERSLVCADWFHGKDGLGDHGYVPRKRKVEATHAVDAMIETIRANSGLTVVTLGPLTNVALALQRDPQLAESIGRCVIMGGNPCCEGNITPAAEFNIYVDPEAARIVFRAGMRIEMVGWHLCRFSAALNQQEIDSLLATKKPLAEFAVFSNSIAAESYFTQTHERGICLPDPTAMGIAIDPKLCIDGTEHHVAVETTSELTRGLTLVDKLNVAGDRRNIEVWGPTIKAQPRKIHVCWTLDVPAWKRMLFSLLTE
ncbi:MAG TPA: nucleoside hydrolase [Candidatus Sulfotelmatobacter sp.]|nr:nucleoside hydrolase [Candidatus Sulfotelmatobacter sp.]